MKRTLSTLALVSIAGAAGAQTITAPTVGGSTVTPPAVPSQSTGAAGANVTTPAIQGGTVQAPSMGAAGASTPGVNPPSLSTPGADPNRAVGQIQDQSDVATDGIKRKIEADGYKNVQGLAKDADGVWHGRAMRGSTEVAVTVDAKGNVASQ